MVALKLDAGDYTEQSLVGRVALERKNLDDYIGSITVNPGRFRRELLILKTYRYAAIIVEGSLEDVFKRRYFASGPKLRAPILGGTQHRPNVEPATVLETTAKICCDFIPVFWGGNRAHSTALALQLLKRCAEKFK